LNVGLLPAAQANAGFATQTSIATNRSLDGLLQLEQLLQGVYPAAVAGDPTHFGSTNITTPCLNAVGNTVCADPDHTLFWDAEHPTAFAHSFFAVSFENALNR
jgi:phospholipase/lecithinase/hemolysin